MKVTLFISYNISFQIKIIQFKNMKVKIAIDEIYLFCFLYFYIIIQNNIDNIITFDNVISKITF